MPKQKLEDRQVAHINPIDLTNCLKVNNKIPYSSFIMVVRQQIKPFYINVRHSQKSFVFTSAAHYPMVSFKLDGTIKKLAKNDQVKRDTDLTYSLAWQHIHQVQDVLKHVTVDADRNVIPAGTRVNKDNQLVALNNK